MKRRGFLRSIGLLAAGSFLPELPATDLVPYKQDGGIEKEIDGQFTNHMSVQRKGHKVTGGPQPVLLFYDRNGLPFYHKLT